MTTIAELIVKTLAEASVRRIWGVTGDSLNALNAAQAKDVRILLCYK